MVSLPQGRMELSVFIEYSVKNIFASIPSLILALK
jgi:hypothetical protein